MKKKRNPIVAYALICAEHDSGCLGTATPPFLYGTLHQARKAVRWYNKWHRHKLIKLVEAPKKGRRKK